MRRNIFALAASALLVLIAVFLPSQAQARKGDVSVGIVGGYTTKNSAPPAGIYFQYHFSDHLGISSQVGCVFRNKNMDNFFTNVNLIAPFNFGDIISIYPLAGVSYTSWDNHYSSEDDIDDVSTRKSRLGLNLGGGLSLRATSTLRLKIDAIYTINDGYSTFTPMVGIGYSF